MGIFHSILSLNIYDSLQLYVVVKTVAAAHARREESRKQGACATLTARTHTKPRCAAPINWHIQMSVRCWEQSANWKGRSTLIIIQSVKVTLLHLTTFSDVLCYILCSLLIRSKRFWQSIPYPNCGKSYHFSVLLWVSWYIMIEL